MLIVKGRDLEKGVERERWTVGGKKVKKKGRRTGQCQVLHDLGIEMNFWLMWSIHSWQNVFVELNVLWVQTQFRINESHGACPVRFVVWWHYHVQVLGRTVVTYNFCDVPITPEIQLFLLQTSSVYDSRHFLCILPMFLATPVWVSWAIEVYQKNLWVPRHKTGTREWRTGYVGPCATRKTHPECVSNRERSGVACLPRWIPVPVVVTDSIHRLWSRDPA